MNFHVKSVLFTHLPVQMLVASIEIWEEMIKTS